MFISERHCKHIKYNVNDIVFQLILILIICVTIFFNQIAFCSLKKDCVHNVNLKFDKSNYYFFNKKNLNFSSEFSTTLFNNSNDFKYCIFVRSQYDFDEKNFLLFKNFVFGGRPYRYIIKNISSLGFGYKIFNGPVYFSQTTFSPSIYYVIDAHNKGYSKILINNNWLYSYQLIHNIYYSQNFTVLSDFHHLVTKLEQSLSLSVKKNILFLKCSYNVTFNENKLHVILPNVNKHIFISLLYSL